MSTTKRTSFDDSRDPSVPLEMGLLPCLGCSTGTRREALANYGGRCFRCYEDYCAGAAPPAPGFADGRRDSGDQAAMRRRLNPQAPRGLAGAALPPGVRG